MSRGDERGRSDRFIEAVMRDPDSKETVLYT